LLWSRRDWERCLRSSTPSISITYLSTGASSSSILFAWRCGLLLSLHVFVGIWDEFVSLQMVIWASSSSLLQAREYWALM
jgi:hypothetical protein